jgi:Fe-S cluster biogenesis protein NfuA/nitrite reductase/ring-hydroxylating ferredoxin subunit
MAEAKNLRATGDAIEQLLDDLRSSCDAPEMERVEELVRRVTELYGAGIEHIIGMIVDADAEQLAPAQILERIVDDELVASLLVLHGLHPLDLQHRVEHALESVRPYLGSHGGDVELVAIDEQQGVARLKMVGSCDGCPSSSVTLQLAVETAIQEAAPEIVRIVAEGSEEPEPATGEGIPVQLTRKGEVSDVSWTPVYGINRLPSGRLEGLDVEGMIVVFGRVGFELYAYLDRCPSCGAQVRDGSLDGEVLRCASCGSSYDMRLAGRSLDGTPNHLDPVPLLDEGGIVKIATTAGTLA